MPPASRTSKSHRNDAADQRLTAQTGLPAPGADHALDMAKIQALVAAVESGSVLAASRALGAPRSTVRRQIDELKAQIGAELLTKKDGKVVPTKAGRVVYERGKALLAGCVGLMHEARQAGGHVARRVQIAVPPGLPMSVFMKCWELQTRAVEPTLLRIAEDPLRLLDAGADIALYVGRAPPEGPWASLMLMPLRRCLVAGRAYAKKLPGRVADLGEHQLLCWHASTMPPPLSLPLRGGGSAPIEPILISNDAGLLRRFAALGAGIAFVPDADLAIPEMRDLVTVLPDVVGDDIALYAVVPNELSDLMHPAGIVSVVRASLAASYEGALLT